MRYKYFIYALLIGSLASCSKDNSNDIINENTQDNVDNNSTKPSDNNNNTIQNSVYSRLEFPQLKNSSTNRVLVYRTNNDGINFCVEWDTSKKTQRWTCYQMYRSNLVSRVQRYYSQTNQYPYDPSLPSQYVISPDPYWGSGYDHGHICPSADRLNSSEANIQTFYMTNMQPQVHGFNAGVWSNMENKLREWGRRNNYSFADTLYICKGGTIDNASQYTTIKGNFIVPKYFYMAVLRVKDGQYNAIGFWVEHQNNGDTNLAKYAVTIKELEEKTGIDFFHNLPDGVERIVESRAINKNLWNIN